MEHLKQAVLVVAYCEGSEVNCSKYALLQRKRHAKFSSKCRTVLPLKLIFSQIARGFTMMTQRMEIPENNAALSQRFNYRRYFVCDGSDMPPPLLNF